jgi:hypothetical protein
MKGADFSGTIDSSFYSREPIIVGNDTFDYSIVDVNVVFDYEFNYIIHYLDIPILAKYKFPNGLNIILGPQLSILLSSKFKYNLNLNGQAKYGLESNPTELQLVGLIEEEVNSKEGLKSIEMGIIAGVGYEFPFGLGIHARYSRGLTDVFDNENGFRNSVIQLGVSYKIFNDLLKFQ